MTVYLQLQVMLAGMKGLHWEAKLCVARRVFKHDVLRMLPSECDDTWKQTSLGIEVRYCIDAVFIEMLSTEPSWSRDFVT